MVYIFLAEGFEEIEAVSIIDILRRGGVDAVSVGVGKREVTGTHKITFVADICSNEASYEEIEMIVFPGGMPGTNNLKSDKTVNAYIAYCMEKDIPIAAICAAPIILGAKGILKGKRAVCYPGCEEQLVGAEISTSAVVQDGNIITSKGPGTAAEFGLYLVEQLTDKKKADAVRADLLL